MWRIYLKSNEGVAIQTNFNSLRKALHKTEENILSSKIRYINYETQTWYDEIEYPHKNYNTLTPLIHKRIEFIHENEFRLLFEDKNILRMPDYWENQENHMGFFIKVDINQLVERIYLPPTIDEKSEYTIRDIVKSQNYNFGLKGKKRLLKCSLSLYA